MDAYSVELDDDRSGVEEAPKSRRSSQATVTPPAGKSWKKNEFGRDVQANQVLGAISKVCFCTFFLSIVISIIEMEVMVYFEYQPNIVCTILKVLLSVLCLVTTILTIVFYEIHFIVPKWRTTWNDQVKFFTSKASLKMWLEVFLNMMHSPPLLDYLLYNCGLYLPSTLGMSTATHCVDLQTTIMGRSLFLHIDFINIIIVCRIYWCLRVIKFNSLLLSKRYQIIRVFSRVKITNGMIFRVLMNIHPVSTVSSLVSLTILTFCYIIYVVERQSNPSFTLLDAFWLVNVTFTTVGYGDVVPLTIIGRLICILAALIGVVVAAVAVAVLVDKLSLTQRESRLTTLVLRYRYRREFEHAAASVLCCRWRLYKESSRKPRSVSSHLREQQLKLSLHRKTKEFNKKKQVWDTFSETALDVFQGRLLQDVMVELKQQRTALDGHIQWQQDLVEDELLPQMQSAISICSDSPSEKEKEQRREAAVPAGTPELHRQVSRLQDQTEELTTLVKQMSERMLLPQKTSEY